MPNKNSTLTLRWMEQVWNQGRETAIDEMMDVTAVVHGIEGIDVPGPEGFKTFYWKMWSHRTIMNPHAARFMLQIAAGRKLSFPG